MYFNDFVGRPEMEAFDAVITCTLLICDRIATSLFNPKSTYYYVSTYFVVGLHMICESQDIHVHVSTLVGDFVIVYTIYHSCEVTLWVIRPGWN